MLVQQLGRAKAEDAVKAFEDSLADARARDFDAAEVLSDGED